MQEPEKKTVIILDKSLKFTDDANDSYTINVKDGPRQKEVAVLRKTIWTCCLEGIVELHRILTDVYPLGDQKIRFAVADFMAKMLDKEWKPKMIDRESLIKMIKTIECPNAKSSSDITPIGGLTMAIEALAIETPQQKKYNDNRKREMEKRKARETDSQKLARDLKNIPHLQKIENNGSLILFTRFIKNDDVEELTKNVAKLIKSRNDIAQSASNKTFCPIDCVRLFIVNFYAKGENCDVETHPLEEFDEYPLLQTWVISRKGFELARVMHSLAVAAFDLSSTTVTKIPMKEDNRHSSNYDVELFHHKSVHAPLQRLGILDIESENSCSDDGVTYDSVKLSWATAPKSKWNLFPFHGHMVACSPAEGYSRPSACLTGFVADGRNVLLELQRTDRIRRIPNNIPNKLVSHMLMANGGRIFIHAVQFWPTKERIVGVTAKPKALPEPDNDVNIHQLKHIFSQVRLVKLAKNNLGEPRPEKCKETRAACIFPDMHKKLLYVSRNIPSLSTDTILFQEPVMKTFEPLLSIVTRTTLDSVDVEKCKACILNLMQLRDSRTAMIPPDSKINVSCVTDLNDIDEQWRVGLVEMARHIANYFHFSNEHATIYQSFIQTLGIDKMFNLGPNDLLTIDPSLPVFEFFKDEEIESTNNQPYLSRVKSKNKRRFEIQTPHAFNKDNYAEERLREEVIEKKMKKQDKPDAKPVEMNLLDQLCTKADNHVKKKRREFVGRETHGNIAPLYPNLAVQQSSSPHPNDDGKRREGSGTPQPSRNSRFNQQ